MEKGRNIKVLLVDDHDIVMDGIASIVSEAPDLQVVGKASCVDQAKELLSHLTPDLVLTDISLGDSTGLELTKYIIARYPAIKVIVLTMHDSVQQISSLLDAGAMGYLLKNVRQNELFSAIQHVMEGKQYIQQSIAVRYSKSLNAQQEAAKQSLLSPREIEIIRLIAKEYTTNQISKELFLSEHTVETHRKNIIRKTGVKSVVGLVNYARERGLLPD
jgi:DNA-binding NarL/FixJ family response regulator